MATTSDHKQEVFGLIDLLYKYIGDNAHAPAVAVVGGVDMAASGAPVSPTNRLPVAVLLREIGNAMPIPIDSATATKTTALPAGTVAVRIQKTATVGVRWRVATAAAADITNTQGGLMLPDLTGFVDVPAAAGEVVQVVRMAGDTGSGTFVVTPLGA